MGYVLDRQDCIPVRSKIFLLSPENTQRPIQWGEGTLSLRAKQTVQEADHWPPSSVEVKKSDAITRPPQMFTWLRN
jgi:hypothetical protein